MLSVNDKKSLEKVKEKLEKAFNKITKEKHRKKFFKLCAKQRRTMELVYDDFTELAIEVYKVVNKYEEKAKKLKLDKSVLESFMDELDDYDDYEIDEE